MSNILIEARNISKVYDSDIFLKRGKNFYALNNVNFVLEKGQFICIMGPSGSGKSTLLNCLSTLDTITSGHVFLKGKDMASLHKDDLCQFRHDSLGFVFQDHNLIPYLSIFDNIATPAMLNHQNMNDLKTRIKDITKELEIEKLLDKFPSECSGGECQRVAIARALINNPEIIFCDEPTGNLDSKNSHKVLNILSRLHQQGTTILLVTHDPLIASYAQTLMYLYDGGIKNVIHRHQSSQIDFYQAINHIVSQDTLMNEIKEEASEKITQPIIEETVHSGIETVENIDKEFVSRQDVYMIMKDQPVDQEILKKSTPFYIDGTKATYSNKYNDEITFDLSEITHIQLNLKAHHMSFGILSQYIFDITMDMECDRGTYKFKLKNKDDFILLYQYLQSLQIPIDDPRKILEAYKKYPRDYERQKFYMRTHKDLTKF
jgi:ABC-type lipoprotein export system ATPase subunit